MPPASQSPPPRGLSERREAALERLASGSQIWLATGSDGRGAHLIPVAYVWTGDALVTATFERSVTTANLQANPQARIAVGTTADVVMIDATARLTPVAEIDPTAADGYAQVSRDPRTVSGFVYIRLTPQRVQVWKGVHEFSGRTVMLDGEWLDRPVD